ncbi:hypothetical protein AWV79_09330 [Cupriavidus sp. UYMMa02A]|nr:hypothetical protein AWV79_09330 [Cupriavidus sp. UYMMa02A]
MCSYHRTIAPRLIHHQHVWFGTCEGAIAHAVVLGQPRFPPGGHQPCRALKFRGSNLLRYQPFQAGFARAS